MAYTLETLILEFAGDTTKLDASINQVVQRARRAAADIEAAMKMNGRSSQYAPIRPRVDMKELHDWNKLMAVKKRDHDDLAAHVTRNPIKPLVDGSELKAATEDVRSLKRELTDVRSQSSASARITVEYHVNGAEFIGRFEKAGESFADNFIKRLGSADIKVTQKGSGLLGGIGNVFKGAIGNTASGLIFGATGEISKGLGKGVSRALEASLTQTIGSSEFAAKKIAEKFVHVFSETLQVLAPKSSRQFAESVQKGLGVAQVAKEGAAVRGKFADTDAESRQVAFEQSVRERRVVLDQLPEMKATQERLNQNRAEIAKEVKSLQERQSKIREKVDKGLTKEQIADYINKSIQKEYDVYAKSLDSMQQGEEGFEINENYKKAEKYVESLRQKVVKPKTAETVTNAEVAEVTQKVFTKAVEDLAERITKNLDHLEEIEDQLLKVDDFFRKAQLNKKLQNSLGKSKQPLAYANIAQQVAAASGVALPQDNIPKIVTQKGMKERGRYEAESNAIYVSEQLAEELEEGILSIESVKTLVHELRHAAQQGFGDPKGLADLMNEQVNIPLMTATEAEIKALGSKIEASVKGNKGSSQGFARKIETDAYVFAERNAAAIHQSFQDPDYVRNFKVAAVGIKDPIDEFLKDLRNLQKAATEFGIDIEADLKAALKVVAKLKNDADNTLKSVFASKDYIGGAEKLAAKRTGYQEISAQQVKSIATKISSPVPERSTAIVPIADTTEKTVDAMADVLHKTVQLQDAVGQALTVAGNTFNAVDKASGFAADGLIKIAEVAESLLTSLVPGAAALKDLAKGTAGAITKPISREIIKGSLTGGAATAGLAVIDPALVAHVQQLVSALNHLAIEPAIAGTLGKLGDVLPNSITNVTHALTSLLKLTNAPGWVTGSINRVGETANWAMQPVTGAARGFIQEHAPGAARALTPWVDRGLGSAEVGAGSALALRSTSRIYQGLQASFVAIETKIKQLQGSPAYAATVSQLSTVRDAIADKLQKFAEIPQVEQALEKFQIDYAEFFQQAQDSVDKAAVVLNAVAQSPEFRAEATQYFQTKAEDLVEAVKETIDAVVPKKQDLVRELPKQGESSASTLDVWAETIPEQATPVSQFHSTRDAIHAEYPKVKALMATVDTLSAKVQVEGKLHVGHLEQYAVALKKAAIQSALLSKSFDQIRKLKPEMFAVPEQREEYMRYSGSTAAIGKRADSMFSEAYDQYAKLAQFIEAGLESGLDMRAIAALGEEIAIALEQGTKFRAGIQSPSKVFRAIMHDVAKGAILGIADYRNRLKEAGAELSQNVADGTTLGRAGQVARNVSRFAAYNAKDLAVNTAGFAAATSVSSAGVVPELAGDLVGALTARLAIELGPALQRALGQAKLELPDAGVFDRVVRGLQILETELIDTAQGLGSELRKDIMGYGIGNTTAKLLKPAIVGAVGAVSPKAGAVLNAIPLSGAGAAFAMVPKMEAAIQKMGRNASHAIADTIDVKAVEFAGKRIGDALTDGTKKSLGIASPSKVFQGLANQVWLGWNLGLSKFKAYPFEAIESKLANIESELKISVAPIFDETLHQTIATAEEQYHKLSEAFDQFDDLQKKIDVNLANAQGKMEAQGLKPLVPQVPIEIPAESQKERLKREALNRKEFQRQLAAAKPIKGLAFDDSVGLSEQLQAQIKNKLDRFNKLQGDINARLQKANEAVETSTQSTASKFDKFIPKDSEDAGKRTAKVLLSIKEAMQQLEDGVPGDLFAGLKRQADDFVSGFNSVLNVSDSLGLGFDKTAIAAVALFSGFNALVALPGALAQSMGNLTRAAFEFGKQSLLTADRLSTLRKTLAAFGATQSQIARVSKSSDILGFDIEGSLKSLRGVKAATQGIKLDFDPAKLVTATQILGRAVGSTEEEMQSGMRAALQTIGKDQAYAEEIFGQLSESIPGSAALLAQEMGLSIAEFRKRMQEGQISAQVFVDALIPAFSKMEGVAKESMGSIAVSNERMANAVKKAQESLNANTLPIIQAAYSKLADVMNGVAENAQVLSAIVGGVLIAGLVTTALAIGAVISAAATLPLIGPIFAGISAIITTQLLPALAALALKFALITVTTSAIIAVGSLFKYSLDQAFGSAGEKIDATTAATKKLVDQFIKAREAANNINVPEIEKPKNLLEQAENIFNPGAKSTHAIARAADVVGGLTSPMNKNRATFGGNEAAHTVEKINEQLQETDKIFANFSLGKNTELTQSILDTTSQISVLSAEINAIRASGDINLQLKLPGLEKEKERLVKFKTDQSSKTLTSDFVQKNIDQLNEQIENLKAKDKVSNANLIAQLEDQVVIATNIKSQIETRNVALERTVTLQRQLAEVEASMARSTQAKEDAGLQRQNALLAKQIGLRVTNSQSAMIEAKNNVAAAIAEQDLLKKNIRDRKGAIRQTGLASDLKFLETTLESTIESVSLEKISGYLKTLELDPTAPKSLKDLVNTIKEVKTEELKLESSSLKVQQAELQLAKVNDTLSASFNRLSASYQNITTGLQRYQSQQIAAIAGSRATGSIGEVGQQQQTLNLQVKVSDQSIAAAKAQISRLQTQLASVTGSDRANLERSAGKPLEQLREGDITRLQQEYTLNPNQQAAIKAQQEILQATDAITQAQQQGADSAIQLRELTQFTIPERQRTMGRSLENFQRTVTDFYAGLEKQLRDAQKEYDKVLLEIQGIKFQGSLAKAQKAGTSNFFAPLFGFLSQLDQDARSLEQQRIELSSSPQDLADQQRALVNSTIDLNRQFEDMQLEMQKFAIAMQGAAQQMAAMPAAMAQNNAVPFVRQSGGSGGGAPLPTSGSRGSLSTAPTTSSIRAGDGRDVSYRGFAPSVNALLNTIASAEGTNNKRGYNTTFGYRQFESMAQHPRMLVNSGGYSSDAAGRYQFMSPTWKEYSQGRDFSPQSQDVVAKRLINVKRGVSDQLIQKAAEGSYESFIKVLKKLGPEWASLGFNSYGQPTKSSSSLWKTFQGFVGQERSKEKSPQVAMAAVTKPAIPQPPIVVAAPIKRTVSEAEIQYAGLPKLAKTPGNIINLPKVNYTEMAAGLRQTINLQSKQVASIAEQNQMSTDGLGIIDKVYEANVKLAEIKKKQYDESLATKQLEIEQRLTDLLIQQRRSREDLIVQTQKSAAQVADLNAQYQLPTFQSALKQQQRGVAQTFAETKLDITRRIEDLTKDIKAVSGLSLADITQSTGLTGDAAQRALAEAKATIPVLKDQVSQLTGLLGQLNPEQAKTFVERQARNQAIAGFTKSRTQGMQSLLGAEAERAGYERRPYEQSELQTRSSLMGAETDFAEQATALSESLLKMPGLSEAATEQLRELHLAASDLNFKPEELEQFLMQMPLDAAAATEQLDTLLRSYESNVQNIGNAQQTLSKEIKVNFVDSFQSSFNTLLNDTADLSTSIGEDLRKFFSSLLSSFGQTLTAMAAKMVASQVLSWLGKIGGAASGGAGSAASTVMSLVGSFYNGGPVVPIAANGLSVASNMDMDMDMALGMGMGIMDAMARERAMGGQPVPIVASVGEEILSQRSGDAQLWRQLERTGQINELKNYADGGTVSETRSALNSATAAVAPKSTTTGVDSTNVNLSLQTVRIMDEEYVSASQIPDIIRASARQGQSMTLKTIKNSPATRRRHGI
ncbi:MAG: tape measure protein [Cetobacterium sp.]